MIRQAKKNKKLYDDLIELGFDDNEFPHWWYSPARVVKKEQAVVLRSAKLSEEPEALPSSVKQVHEPVISRDPTPRDRGSSRPPLTDLNLTELNRTPDNSEELDTTQDISEFSQEEITLLASNKVFRSPDSGEWYHSKKYPDGRTMITSVDPARVDAEFYKSEFYNIAQAKMTIIHT